MTNDAVNASVAMNAGYGIARWNCTASPVGPAGQLTEFWIATSRSSTPGVAGSSTAYAVRDWSRIQAGPAASFRTSTRSIENATAAQFTGFPEVNVIPGFSVRLYVMPSRETSAGFVTSGTFVASIGLKTSAFSRWYQIRPSATFWMI